MVVSYPSEPAIFTFLPLYTSTYISVSHGMPTLIDVVVYNDHLGFYHIFYVRELNVPCKLFTTTNLGRVYILFNLQIIQTLGYAIISPEETNPDEFAK